MGKKKEIKLLDLEKGTVILSKEKREKEEKKEKQRFLKGMNLATEMGFAIAVPIAGGALLGFYLDGRLGTTPKCTLSLLFLGIISAFYYIYKLIKDFN